MEHISHVVSGTSGGLMPNTSMSAMDQLFPLPCYIDRMLLTVGRSLRVIAIARNFLNVGYVTPKPKSF